MSITALVRTNIACYKRCYWFIVIDLILTKQFIDRFYSIKLKSLIVSNQVKMLKVQILYAVALCFLFIDAGDCADKKDGLFEKLNADKGFTIFKDSATGTLVFDAVQKTKNFFDGTKMETDIIQFLASIPLFQGDVLVLAFDAITLDAKSDITTVNGYVENFEVKITDSFEVIKRGISDCVNVIKSFVNNNTISAMKALEKIVNSIFGKLDSIIERFTKPEYLLHLIPQTVIPIKFLVSTLAGVVIKIDEALGLHYKDITCEFTINVKDHFQAFLMERFKLVKMTYHYEADKDSRCSVEQKVLNAPFDNECPSYDRNKGKCKRSDKDYYDEKDELGDTGRELVKDLLVSKDDYYYGKHGLCSHYYLCRLRDILKQAFNEIHELINQRSGKECPLEKPIG